MAGEVFWPESQRREEALPAGRGKLAIEGDCGGAGAEGSHRKPGSAQGEADGHQISGGTLWAESATEESMSGIGSEHVEVPQ